MRGSLMWPYIYGHRIQRVNTTCSWLPTQLKFIELCAHIYMRNGLGLSQFSLLRTLSVCNSYIALPTTYMKLGRLQALCCLVQSD